MKNTQNFQLLVFIAIRTVLNTAVRMVYPYLGVFGRGMGVDIWMLSRAVTLRSAMGIFGPFLASISDTRGRRFGMIFGLVVFTASMVAMILHPTALSFVIMLVLSILGIFAFLPSMQAYLGDKVAYERRGFVYALTELSWSISFILGVPIVGFLIAQGSWKTPFPIIAAAGLLSLFLLAWMLPKDRPEKGTVLKPWQNLRQVFTYTPAIAGIAIGMGTSSANELVNLIFGVWLEDAFQVKIAALSAASLVIGLSELGGETLVAGFTDRLGKHFAVGSGLVFNSLVAVSLPLLGVRFFGALVGLFLFYLTFEFTIVSCLPLVSEILPGSRATMMAAFISGTSLGRALGDVMAPYLYQLGESTQAVDGMFVISLGVLGLNLMAFMALRILKKQKKELVRPA